MKTLTKTLKHMLNAMAYADAGEYLSEREKTEILSQTVATVVTNPPPKPVVAQPTRAARHVALYMGSELPADVMTYIVQTCVRLKHALTVLTFETETTARNLLKPYEQALADAGVELQLVALAGEPLPRLARYLRSHPEVAFMACKDTGYLGRGFVNGTQRKNALPVPVVVVVAQQEARAQQANESKATGVIGKSSVA